jgi:serine phosphatase RsbU (regulator of sigma subunit)/anti-sigma regulatory factor (Ser/Thr protein kinase)
VVLRSQDLGDALSAVHDGELRTALSEHPPTSTILLPLVSGGRALGVLVVTTEAGGHPPLAADERDHLEELAGRLALAIDSARLLRQQIEIAHTLQRSLLPASLPRVPGAEVAVRYLPGAEGVDVGGDFYDVIPLPNGRIGLVVGDVMGRGVRAAAVMGQLRAAVRSYCLEGHPPAALLTRLDRLVATLEEGLLVTAFYAEWDPGFGFALCACAGHLPPLVRLPGGTAAYLEIDPAVPLGVGAQSYQEVEVPLPPGSLLLAYTDGLVEGPDLPVEDGMRQLAAAVTDATRAIEVCDAALHDLRPASGTRQYDDDIALLALVTHAGDTESSPAADPASTVTVDLPADYNSPSRARAVVAQTLHRWGLGALVDVGTLLVSELVTNGVRHAGTGLRVTINRLGESRVRVGVSDRAAGVQVRVRSSDTTAEGGRGLFLVEHLAAGWGSLAETDGKTVWFELQA